MSLSAILVHFKEGKSVRTKQSRKNVYIKNLLSKELHFDQSEKNIHGKISPQFLNHFLNNEVFISTKLFHF